MAFPGFNGDGAFRLFLEEKAANGMLGIDVYVAHMTRMTTGGCRAHRFQIIVELSRIDPGVLERSRTLLVSVKCARAP
jgi:hypothetical protein